jgi:hypothetical protein
MALPASGVICMSQIKAALGSTSNSLRAYAVAAKAATGLAKFDAPDMMCEFYSYAAPTPPPPTPAPPTPAPPTPAPPTPAPPTQTTFTGFVSIADEQSACDGGEYGLVSITVFGTTLCDATSVRAMTIVATGVSVYVDLIVEEVFYISRLSKARSFTRNSRTATGRPNSPCTDCATPPPPTPPPPTPPPPTPAPPTPPPPTPPPPTPPPPTPPPPTPAPLPIYNSVYLSSGTNPCDASNNSGGAQA